MSATTQANILLIAPEFSSVAAEIWTLILADVAAEISSSVYGTSQERAQRYLAAHYLAIINSGGNQNAGAVISETVGQVSKTYAQGDYVDKNRLDETGYGRMFNQIRRGRVVGFTVITP